MNNMTIRRSCLMSYLERRAVLAKHSSITTFIVNILWSTPSAHQLIHHMHFVSHSQITLYAVLSVVHIYYFEEPWSSFPLRTSHFTFLCIGFPEGEETIGEGSCSVYRVRSSLKTDSIWRQTSCEPKIDIWWKIVLFILPKSPKPWSWND